MDDNFNQVVEDTRAALNAKFDDAVSELVDEAAVAVAALFNDPAAPKTILGAVPSTWLSGGAGAAIAAALATFAPSLAGLLP